MHVPYHIGHHHMGVPSGPGVGMHHYSGHPPFAPGPPRHHHPIGLPPNQPNPLNGFHVAHFEAANVAALHHPGGAFAGTSTSTLIAHHHHQTGTQSVSTALSKDEFYLKQRYLQRT
jgi:hypothetical protein